MAKEYIERDVAIEKTEAFCDVFVTQWTDEKVLAWIRNLPTADVVEVVRCAECERRSKSADLTDTVYCPWLKQQMRKTDFCSYGERRTNE